MLMVLMICMGVNSCMAERIIGVLGNVPFDDMTDEEIELCLVQIDVAGRFDGDIELLNRIRCPEDTFEGMRILRDLYARAQAEDAKRRLSNVDQEPELLRQILEHIGLQAAINGDGT